MESKLIFLKTAFDDFYGPGNTNIKEYKDTKYTGRITPTDQNVYVHDCFFQSCSSSSEGGAVYCSSSVYKLLVEQTSFISCKTSNGNGGGAIHFNSQSYGECILSKVCGFDCSSTKSDSRGQFGYIYIKNDVTYKNQVNDSSFTRSLNEVSSTFNVLYLKYGNILCPSVNLTNNLCYYNVVLETVPTIGTGSPASETCCISFSSIVNNTANHNLLIYFDTRTTKQCIDTCNIISNKQNVNSNGIITTNANLLIKDSCIIGNDERYRVFHVYTSGKVTISNCTFDDDIFTNGRYSGDVTVIKTITKSFINALSHISTQHCDSYFDSYGTLTVEPNVPSKISHCLISCNNQYQTYDLLRYIQFIFLLTFLPSDPSNGNYFK